MDGMLFSCGRFGVYGSGWLILLMTLVVVVTVTSSVGGLASSLLRYHTRSSSSSLVCRINVTYGSKSTGSSFYELLLGWFVVVDRMVIFLAWLVYRTYDCYCSRLLYVLASSQRRNTVINCTVALCQERCSKRHCRTFTVRYLQYFVPHTAP